MVRTKSSRSEDAAERNLSTICMKGNIKKEEGADNSAPSIGVTVCVPVKGNRTISDGFFHNRADMTNIPDRISKCSVPGIPGA